MRRDVVGFWWDDIPPPKAEKAQAEKRKPPARTWEEDSYLPGLEEALRFDVPLYTSKSLYEACKREEPLLFDIECFPNFFQVAFTSLVTGYVVDFLRTEHDGLNTEAVQWIVDNFMIVGFNSTTYDMPMLALALHGLSCAQLKEASDMLILEKAYPGEVFKMYGARSLRGANHIDLIEVAPLMASLKTYSGRLHARRMQDLPFSPYKRLNGSQMAIVRWYCLNDLASTGYLATALSEQMKLRNVLTAETGIDVRSKSDAQIAEAVLSDGMYRLTGQRPTRPTIAPGTVYRYQVPAYMQFKTPLLQSLLEHIATTDFIVSEEGNIATPPQLKGIKLRIGDSTYRVGIGGLHSSESKAAHIASPLVKLWDADAESYYPRIILNQGLYPKHLGPAFLQIYNQLVERRLQAKHRGDKVASDSLKITINGSFGKLGSPFSTLYAPDLLIQVTVSGQLTLLMLIEDLELNGIAVVSANTDGIMIKCPVTHEQAMQAVIKEWEARTCFVTEMNEYRALYSRDVNNYIAIKKSGGTKTKGAFANPWSDTKNMIGRLQKNPTNQICIDAVQALLELAVPIETTIRACTDITKFVCVRKVKGGAVKDGVYLGKSIRWYYATGEAGEIIYAETGNKVPRSEGARPCMELPAQLPGDVDHAWYIAETESILRGIGYEM